MKQIQTLKVKCSNVKSKCYANSHIKMLSAPGFISTLIVSFNLSPVYA